MAAFDPDHALAILLQAKFNEEAKKSKSDKKANIPVNIPVKKPVTQPSLIDPEWETTDPCPDIHGLFLAFNDRFFWGRLLGIEVKWSAQMTSCAGICVYEGRNGLCSVRLSAPLLKLRPRSDLIETLLHEMIHAYLFVTNNNRDREGHGPEFHKHMYRINREAGTNITVYHSFHAEVKVYQQHWWRCNGPCQYRAPYFGMVKRAKNRAPAHYDIWWDSHRAECGGEFVKVREPPGYKSKNNGKENKAANPSKGKDIRNFFKKPVMPTNSTTITTATSGSVGSNIFGFNSYNQNSSVSTANIGSPKGGGPINHVVGFKDLNSADKSSLNKPKPTGFVGGGHILGGNKGQSSKENGKPNGFSPGSGIRKGGGMLANRGGGTLVVTGNQNKMKNEDKASSPNTKLRVDKFHAFSGSGFTLGGPSSSGDRSKSRLLSIDHEPKQKKVKVEQEYTDELSNISELGDQMCRCSVCNESMPREEADVHLESCLGLQNIFNNSSVVDDIEEKEINDINNKSKIIACPICSLHIEGDINIHIDECLNTSGIVNVFNEPPIELSDSESPVKLFEKHLPKPASTDDMEIIESEARVACPLCGMRFGESRINAHVNQCLDSD